MGLHLISGPPGSGKTTLANKLQKSGDLIFDFDAVAIAIGAPVDNSQGGYVAVIEAMRDALLRQAKTYKGTLFVIVSNPQKAKVLARRHGGELTVLEVPADQCVQRLINDQRPGLDRRIEAVKSWWRRYQRS